MPCHRIGTFGWSYANWRGPFYPRHLKPGDWLGFYAERLRSVELNASFYRLPSEAMLDAWRAKTPDGFLFAVKAWRAITHHRRLADCDDLLARFLARIDRLGDKCGPLLFQLPPRLPADPDRLDRFLQSLPTRWRYAFEFRDPDWHREEIYDLLRAANAAFVVFELGALRAPRLATADFVYLRLHGRKARYRGAYGAAALVRWADWLRGQRTAGRDLYVYFDNTDEADHAVRDAMTLDGLLTTGGRSGPAARSGAG